MGDPVTFTIEDKPFGKERPRHGKFGTYTPAKTVANEGAIAWTAKKFFNAPIEGPVRVTVWATFKPAPSWSKKKTAAHLGKYHTQKPDSDNVQKSVFDGLNGIAFKDDSQVADAHIRKVWGPVAQTVVTVEALA